MNAHTTAVGGNTQSLFIAMLQTTNGMSRNSEIGELRALGICVFPGMFWMMVLVGRELAYREK